MLSKAYIEDYHYIKLLVHEKEMGSVDIDNLFMTNGINKFKLSVFKIEQFGEYFHINTTFKGRILLHKDYFVLLHNHQQIHVDLGQIMRSERFDVENEYDGPLGIEYHLDYTIFRIWSPVAKEVKLVLTKDNHREEQNLEFIMRGLWEVKVMGNWDAYQYHYEVRINTEFEKTLDPYAISSMANSEENYVIDFNKTYQMRNEPSKCNSYLDAIIYELHLKDTNDTNQVSSYLALISKIPYLQSLGITHLQVMPINAFGGVDELKPDQMYNWGYNPVEFNVPTGWYASSPQDPYCRINELKEMIDRLHQANLNINLDVVYNHVYNTVTFSLNKLVPGYVYRTDKQGFLTNGSGCGCDFASERRMNRRFIIDSLKYWVRNYQVDGFRFDLMGLIDYETLIIVEKELRKINPQIMLYGEGWNLPTALPATLRATIMNNWALPGYAFFNDYFRNVMRGEQHNDQGYLYNQNMRISDIQFVIKGSSSQGVFLDSPSQSINYIECHDNLTFYDKLIRDKVDYNSQFLENYVILSLGTVVLSLGIPFIQAGEEMIRTKQGIDNSYNLGLDINGVSYQECDKYHNIIEALKFFIQVRKEQELYHLNDSDIVDQVLKISNTNQNTVIYETDKLMVIFKNNIEKEEVLLSEVNHLIFRATNVVDERVSQLLIDQIGVYILTK